MILIFILLSKNPTLNSQNLFTQDSSKSKFSSTNNFIQYGMERILNTFQFKGNANYFGEYQWGRFYLLQNYLGKGILTSSIKVNDNKKFDFWDDEIINLGLDLNLYNNLQFTLKQKGTYYAADLSSQAISSIAQSRTTGGIKYNFNDNIVIEGNSGYEINSQRNDRGDGPVYEFSANTNNLKFENFLLNSNLLGEYISLNDGRRKSIFDVKCALEQSFDEFDNMKFDLRYKTFLYPVSFSDVGKGSIKNRFEENLNASVNLNFSLTENFFAGIGLVADLKDVSHYYNKFYEVSKRTGIEAKRNELKLNFSGQLGFRDEIFLHSIGFNYLRNDENNTAINKFGVSSNDLISLRSEEKLLDNIYEITQLRFRSEYILSRRDSIIGNIFLSLFRYDTPSEQINDDRDELTESISLRYSRKFSDNLSVGIESELDLIHYVYIKSQRSADNHWNRSLRFSPFVSINNKYLTMNPNLYVSANYYIYDFEDKIGGINSYSIREIGFKDSLAIKFTKIINLNLKAKLRYYEQGYLFWNEFAETPQFSNYENFLECILYNIINENLWIGSGIRYFELKQKNLLSYAFNNIGFEHYSYAPEFIINYETKNGIDFEIRGWYEFQKSNKESNYREVPNLILMTRINFN